MLFDIPKQEVDAIIQEKKDSALLFGEKEPDVEITKVVEGDKPQVKKEEIHDQPMKVEEA